MTDFAQLLKIQIGKHPSVLWYVKSGKCKAFLELFIPTPPAQQGDCWHSAQIQKLQMKVLGFLLLLRKNK